MTGDVATATPRPSPPPRGWVRYFEGCWRHAPWWKRAINTVLRFFQTRRRPARLLVVYTKCEPDYDAEVEDRPPRIVGYGIGRVLHLPTST